jgi:proteasome assembly chaperone 2
VGELAVDAIVATLRLPLAARGADPNVLPTGGHGAFDHLDQGGTSTSSPALATSLELYGGGNNKNNLFILQQRAPAVPGRQRAFAEAAAKAAKSGGVARVLLLCGLDAAWRRERQIDDAAAHPLRTVVTTAANDNNKLADAASEAARALPLEPSVEADEREAGGRLPPWTLLDAFEAEKVPATLLCCFCSEGDNAPHGLALAAAALRALAKAGVVESGGGGAGGGGEAATTTTPAFDASAATPAQLRTPKSWVGLYGRPPVRALY